MSPVDAMVYEEGWYRSRYGIDELRKGKYPDWKWDCQLLLKEYKVWDIVSGESKRPVKKEGQEPLMEDVLAWEKKDKKALAIIGFTIIGELLRPVRQAKSAKEAWDELEKVHAPNEKAWEEFEKLHIPNDRQRQFARQLALSRQLHSCKMSSNTALKDHEREFSNIIDALRATGEAMNPREVVTPYLLSLSEEYEAFAEALFFNLSWYDTWTFDSVKGMVRVEAQRRANAITTNVATSRSQPKPDPQSAKARLAKGKKARGKKGKFTGNCYHCGVIGHIQSQCPKLIEEKKREKKANAFSGFASAFLASSDGAADSDALVLDIGTTSRHGRAI